MIFEKKAARLSVLTKVFEFFSRARECEAASLAKIRGNLIRSLLLWLRGAGTKWPGSG